MATLYAISVGYNSSFQEEDVWHKLVEVVNELRNNSQRIIDEVFRLESDVNKETIKSLAEMYDCFKGNEDLTLRIVVPDKEDERRYIMQSASGGRDWRKAKESCRRAFCRLVLEEIHKNKMEINIDVS